MPEPKAKATSLHAKLAEVMEEVQRIDKKGQAPAAMGGFKFVQIGDVADPVRKALAKRHLTMLPTSIEVIGQAEHETKSGGSMTTLDVRVTWTVTDGESGDSITLQSIGAGADGGDKYTGKAITNAMKYALLTAFLLPTGDDPEADASSIDRGQRRTNGRRTDEEARAFAQSATDGRSAPVERPAAPVTTEPTGRLSTRSLFDLAENAGKKNDLGSAAKRMWGKSRILDLDDEQRWAVAAEMSLVEETNGRKPAPVEAEPEPVEPEVAAEAESGTSAAAPETVTEAAARIFEAKDDPDLTAGMDLLPK